MKHTIKKIEVCHGPTCGPAGARQIKRRLEEALQRDGTTIVERGCCGRCTRNNTIVADNQPISALTIASVDDFIANPAQKIEDAKRADSEASKDLSALIDGDLLFEL